MLTNTTAPPTDQRAGVRPISFVLQNGNSFGEPVTLRIRPADLVRNEPMRVAVHQTLGREVAGWVDNYGLGLPSVTISGNTGWRVGGVSGMDGAAAFERLNNVVMHEFAAMKQWRIQSGLDPAGCKLLFVDMLDNFTWSVVAPQFELRRNRSNPLLYMYNIRLQAISTDVDNPLQLLPFTGSVSGGLRALDTLLDNMESMASSIQGWVGGAVAAVDSALAPVANVVNDFYQTSLRAFHLVNDTVATIQGGAAQVTNRLIGIASDIAGVGTNVFRSISAIASIPGQLKSNLMRVAGAFNEALCILKNSLKPRKLYEDYDNIYGASNCSSTTGGRPASMYANSNIFSMIQSDPAAIAASGAALGGISAINRGDPALAPMDISEMGGHLSAINDGLVFDVGMAA